MLRYERGLSFDEIGHVLGIPESTARSHVHRARKDLVRRDDRRRLDARAMTATPGLRHPVSLNRPCARIWISNYRRWLSADEHGDDADADAAFGAVFEACVSDAAPVGAVHGADHGRDYRGGGRRCRARPPGAAACFSGRGCRQWPWRSTSAPGRPCRPCPARFVGALNLLVAMVVWFANGPDVRTGVWSVLTGLGRAAAAFVADPRVTVAMLVFQVVAVAALAALHRLLGPEREWLK